MANVRLNWALPTPTTRQRPIARTVIEARVSAALPWSLVNTIDAPTSTLLLQDIAPGDWEFRGYVVDTANVPGPPRATAISIAFDAPSELVDFTAAVE